MLKTPPFSAGNPGQRYSHGPLIIAVQSASANVFQKAPSLSDTYQIHFGANVGNNHPKMPFQQDLNLSDAGTAENPISPNNCTICSLKNLLVYYGNPAATADQCIQTIFTTEANKAASNLNLMPTFPNPDNPAEQELNPSFVISCLEKPGGLNIGLATHDRTINDNSINGIIDRSHPFLVCANGDRQSSEQEPNAQENPYTPETHTLATNAPGKGHDIVRDHTYLMVPDRLNPGQWTVIDPQMTQPTSISTTQLKNNLKTLPRNNQTKYWEITRPPAESYVKRFTPTQETNKTSTTQSGKARASTPSSSGKNSPKKGFFTRVAGWFQRQLQKVVNAIKTVGRWLKKPFSSKAK